MSRHLLIFLFLKTFERVVGLVQTCFFFFSFDVVVEILGSWITDSRVFSFIEESLISGVFFCRGISDFSENILFLFWWEMRGNLLIFFFYFNWVGRVNLEYHSSHLSLIDSRMSLGINLYLVLESLWPTSKGILLGRVVPDLTDFLNPSLKQRQKYLKIVSLKRL